MIQKLPFLSTVAVHFAPSASPHPDELDRNGIQGSSFVPCTQLLKNQFDATDLESGIGKPSVREDGWAGVLIFRQIIDGSRGRCRIHTMTL